jgi:hypothetical protein
MNSIAAATMPNCAGDSRRASRAVIASSMTIDAPCRAAVHVAPRATFCRSWFM